MGLIFTLFVVYQFKHFIADFLLQGKYMLGKFKPGWDFVKPLAAHCGVHAGFTLVITLVVRPAMWWLCLVDFTVHFIMDRIKASPRMLGRYQALSKREMVSLLSAYTVAVDKTQYNTILRSNVLFWWSLGLDQMVHCLTHYFIIYMLVS